MDAQDPRSVLGLPLDATRGEAQRAFRRLAKATHPDAGGDPAAFRAVAGAWADLAAVLPLDRPARLSPHALAYRPPATRTVWTERRPSVPAAPGGAARVAAPAGGRDFASILQAAMARQAA